MRFGDKVAVGQYSQQDVGEGAREEEGLVPPVNMGGACTLTLAYPAPPALSPLRCPLLHCPQPALPLPACL